MELVHFYLIFYNKIKFFTDFLVFFPLNFPLLDPDPGGKMNADLSGSGSTVLVKVRKG